MIRNVLEHIRGIDAYPLIAFVLFLLVFGGVVVWVIRLKGKDLEHMRRLPLQKDDPSDSKGDARS